MTLPDDPKIDMDAGEDVPRAVLEQFGVKNADELAELAQKHRSRVFFERRSDERLEKMQVRIEELEMQLTEKQEHEDFGDISDPHVKALKREIRELRDTVSQVLITDEDRELDPYLETARKKYPEIARTYKDPLKRLDVYREIARSLRSATETEKGAGNKPRKDGAEHVGLTTGSAPVSSRASTSDDDVLGRFKRDLAAAKTTTEKDAVKKKYEAKYPHLFA